MNSKKLYSLAKFALAAAALTLAGCALVKRDEDASVIKEKSVQRWNFLIAHQSDKAYDFLSPGFRATVTREDYATGMNNRPVRWEAAQFVDQSCDADICTVHLKLRYKVAVNLHGAHQIQGDSPVTERWIKESGVWYILPDTAKLPKAKG